MEQETTRSLLPEGENVPYFGAIALMADPVSVMTYVIKENPNKGPGFTEDFEIILTLGLSPGYTAMAWGLDRNPDKSVDPSKATICVHKDEKFLLKIYQDGSLVEA